MGRQSGEARRKPQWETKLETHRRHSGEGDKVGDAVVDQVPRLEPCAYMGREGEVAIPYPCF